MAKSNNENAGHHEGALLEEIRVNFKRLSEGMSSVKATVDDMNSRLTIVEHQAELIPAIKAAVTGQITLRAPYNPRAGWQQQINQEIAAHGPLDTDDD